MIEQLEGREFSAHGSSKIILIISGVKNYFNPVCYNDFFEEMFENFKLLRNVEKTS